MLYLKTLVGAVVLMVLWAVLVLASAYFSWFASPLAEPGDTEAFFRAVKELIDQRQPPTAAFALIEDGRLYGDYYSSSVGEELNADTLFPMASMSKWVTAYGVMLLSEEGKLDLDRPIQDYLTRWQLPPSEFDNAKVTARLLLSHRAGIHDGLGFGDYTADETLPSLEESLTNPRASSGDRKVLGVTSEPGESFDYSGGSYHILELVIEEITGMSFEQFINDEVFTPLGMTRSNYDYIAGQENSVLSYTTSGDLAPQYQYASAAATALNTSINDFSRFLRAQIPDSGVEGVVSQDSITAMRQLRSTFLGMPLWGMGVMLAAETDQGNFIFGHAGGNDPAINTMAAINPDTGDGFIILCNGDDILPGELILEWPYWQANKRGWLALLVKFESIINTILAGCVLILLLGIVYVVYRSRRSRVSPMR